MDVDLWEVLPYPGDRVLLCSDGLVREVTDDQIAAVLRRLADPGEAAAELVARARSAGGSDNITVVVVDVVADDGLARAANDAVGRDGGERPSPSPSAPGRDGDTARGGAAPAGSDPVAALPPPPKRRRRLTVRAVAFVVVLAAVLAGAGWALVTYARDSYFVTLGVPGAVTPSPLAGPRSQALVIEKGRPGGLLWFHPTVVERTTVLSDEVLPSHLADLRKGRVEPSLAKARAFVANLVQEAAQSAPSTSIPVATTTTLPAEATTVPGATPTTR